MYEVQKTDNFSVESTFFEPSTSSRSSTSESAIFAVEKELRALSPEEMRKFAKEVKTAREKELASWVKHKTGRPMLVSDYSAKTGLRPLPSRSVTEWKMKEGVKVIKDRLVLKGFAERNTHTLNTSSPTASRLGHRIILLLAAILKAPIWSLDISTAFLQGWTFSDMANAGYDRQPVAMFLSAEIWSILASLCPGERLFKEAARNPELFCYCLDKAAYGLKDAPLLWNLRLVQVLTKQLGLKRSPHDACVFFRSEKEQILVAISLHVDDTLLTGVVKHMTDLHIQLEKHFGALKKEENAFRHFGIDISRKQHDVLMSQQQYLSTLKPVTVNRTRGEGRTQDTPGTEAEITDFRSLVAGISWVGVTHPGAQAAASLYQTYLPHPTIKQILNLNSFLNQLVSTYTPLRFASGFDLRDVRILCVCDSSLGNSGVEKYSQGAHTCLLARGKQAETLCGPCIPLTYRSGKSKRVANSTMAAECLAQCQGIEEGLLLQTWLHELTHPSMDAKQLLAVPPKELSPLVGVMDCEDLHAVLIKPAAPTPTNKSLVLHLSSLRESLDSGRVQGWVWVSTDDMLSNAMTKLESDGTLPMEPLTDMLRTCCWTPNATYKFGSHRRSDSKAKL